MTGLVVLIPIAIAMGGLALVSFLWALQAGQYEDLDGAAQRVLDDDAPLPARADLLDTHKATATRPGTPAVYAARRATRT